MAIIKIRNAAIDLDAAEIPNLPATKITSGTLATARLGSGTASGTTFLAGDSSYKEVSGGVSWQSTIVTASTLTAVSGNGYWINTTSNACTITLPANPTLGDEIVFVDYARNWGTNAITINTNSKKYQGNTSPNPVYNTNGQSVKIVYSDTTKGWIPTTDDDVSFETPQFSGNISYLVVAGGGSGGNERGGGGGAGGYRTNYGGSAITIQQSQTYTITVGTGGAAKATNDQGWGNSGTNSLLSGTGITTITSTGGGGGGAAGVEGRDGGSGGGAYSGQAIGSGNTPSTTPSQGNDGGSSSSGSPHYGSGGGGGSSAVGANGANSGGGNGGAGTSNSITGSAVTYAGGGGGGVYNSTSAIGTGGAGGGGNGGSGGNGSNNLAATGGTDGLGGGGGGAARYGSYTSPSGKGGDGVVIIRMSTADYNLRSNITGTFTSAAVGTDTYIKWTASGSLVM